MIRILLINEQKVVREGLQMLLGAEPDLEVVGSVNNGNAALSTIQYTNLDLVIVNKKLTEINEFALIKKIKQQYPKIKIIVFSNQIDKHHFIRSLELGVAGYIYETSPVEEIKGAIRSVYCGNNYLDNTAIANIIIPKISKSASDSKQPKLDLQEAQIIFDNKFLFQPFLGLGHLTKPPLNPINDDLAQDNHLALSESEEKDNEVREKKVNLWLVLAGLGLAATALGFVSQTYRREVPIVIDNAIINGEKISITSPTEGTLQEVNYEKGETIEANEILAKIAKSQNFNTEKVTAQLEVDIDLKQQQITNTNKFISVLEGNLNSDNDFGENINLEQQILNQKLAANLLTKELDNLQEKLSSTKSQFINDQVFNVTAPLSGKISDLNSNLGEFVTPNQQIATIVDCQNLWIEAIAAPEIAAKLNLQQKVVVQLSEQENSLPGEITLIEILEKGLSRIVVDINFASLELTSQDYCNLGLSAQISI